jgi:hypothetical protein
LAAASDWLAGYRRFWDGSFDRLEQHINRITGSGQGRETP